MKHSKFFSQKLFLLIPLLFFACGSPQNKKSTTEGTLQGKISISGAFALYPLTVKWAEEFESIHPDVEFDISAGGAGKGMADVLSGMVDLAMFSREVNPMETKEGAWKITVAKDAVFPTVCNANPYYDDLVKQGLTKEQFQKIFTSENLTWEDLLGNGSTTKVNVYTRSDACGAAATWAKYLGYKQEDLKGTGIYGDPGLADAVRKDKLGLGYNNLIYLYNPKTKAPNEGVSVLPIDFDGDGEIGKHENFYSQMDIVMKAIQEGAYPTPPSRNLYLISKGKPTSDAVLAFLNYVMTEGQQFVAVSGYIQIDSLQLNNSINKLNN